MKLAKYLIQFTSAVFHLLQSMIILFCTGLANSDFKNVIWPTA